MTNDYFKFPSYSTVLSKLIASDATKIPLRQKAIKVEKGKPKPKKRGRPQKGEKREAIEPSILQKQKDMQSVEEMLALVSTDCGVGSQTKL